MSYAEWLYGASQVCVGVLLAVIVLQVVDTLARWRRGGRGVL
ncbi:hypothetical protein LCGC14_2519680 [marine sediment metagenome]|uniref:Uncharacterized protein n=1 Tax=marine sediment metagenome TaxID=412755 RepID=A0A0F9AX53_9ZZZZ